LFALFHPILTGDPQPKDQEKQEGRVVLRLASEPIAGQPWKWTVKYRLGSQP
jgi:hypothetical protein